MAEFNFLPPKKVETNEIIQKRSRYIRFSLFFIVLFLVIGLSSWVVAFIQDRHIQDSNNKKENYITLLKQEQQKIDLLAQVHRKVEAIKYIFASQFDYSNSFKNFFQLLPAGVNADLVEIGSGGNLTATLTASSSGALKDLIDKTTNPVNKYSVIKVGDIKSSDKGGYSLDLEFKIPNNNK